MADASSTTDSPSTDSGTASKKKGGLLTFIKKNKTLSAVVGGIGGYLLYKMSKEKSEGGTEPAGEVSEVGGAAEGGAIAGTAEAAAFELGRAERTTEQSRGEVEELETEREEERAKRKEKEKEGVEEEHPTGAPSNEPTVPGTGGGTGGGEVEPTQPAAGGVTIHGRNFPGATSSHIAKTGQTSGGKKYVEYAIQFPGKVEHWQFFTETGNWRQVAGSATGAGANAPGPGNNPKPNPTPAGGAGGGLVPGSGPKAGLSQAEALQASRHPNRPSKPSQQPKPAPQPAPPRAPDCAPGTVGNILHARAEIQRLQGEIDSLQAHKPKGWAANVASKQATRNQFQQVVANGHAQPGCGNV